LIAYLVLGATMINYKEIERKWQNAWEKAKIFEVEPNDRKPMLVTAAFPYVNSLPHIGHMRTYGTADTYARYKRMQSFNVLYPMAFHATGTPLLAFAKRIGNNDQELIDQLKMFHIPDNEIRNMTDPKYMADYFIKDMESGMRLVGYGIDWRRKFISIEPLYSKFVEWQFAKLKEHGYITKGRHPIGWCTNDNNPVGQHDTKHDVQPEIEAVSAIKFKDSSSNNYFVCTTYRPETIYAVSNLFIDENAQYVLAKVKNDHFYMTKEAAEILKHQLDGLEIESEISAKDLLSKKAINPVNNSEVPILPGFFVKPDLGTGIVMSVPAHAPFDYAALQRLKKQNYPVPAMEYKKVVEIEKKDNIGIGRSVSDVSAGQVQVLHPEIPALAYLEVLHANEDAIDDMLEFATKLLYREESHWGYMTIDEYKGMKEPEAREKVKKKLQDSNNAFEIYIIANDEPVYCRCGTKVIVKFVSDQWFINYGDEEWKENVRRALKKIKIYPEKLRLTFENVVEWINVRAAERSQGLGTKFPFDTNYVIESLSDSTLYMCFYTFVHILRNEKITPEQLKPEFFDYVITSFGDLKKISESTSISEPVIIKCKESFDYWYSNTSRHSAPDLIPNHLTMYIFNHVALLDQPYLPKQIVVNGLVNYEGEKMSKSLGNIIPLIDGVEKYGSDPLRFIEITGADLDTTTEFSIEGINSVSSRNEFLYKQIFSLPELKSKELSHIDYWLYSKLNSKIKMATVYMENVNLKGAYTEIFYNSINELKKYNERGGDNEVVLREFLENFVLMLSPAMPHVSEEFWSLIGKTNLVAQERWPEASEDMINMEEESVEDTIDNTMNDIKQSIELTSKIPSSKGKSVKGIKIIIAEDWKLKVYSKLAETKSISVTLGSEEFKELDRSSVAQFVTQYSKKINTLIELKNKDTDLLIKAFVEAKDYIGSKFNAQVDIEKEHESKSERAKRALPGKPSIDIIWG
jgi:leucyl-tRNA synthetase